MMHEALRVPRGGIMQRRHCETGTNSTISTRRTPRLGVAETRKRRSMVASKGECLRLRAAEEAKTAYEKAKCNYLDHVIACPLCDAHVLAPPLSDGLFIAERIFAKIERDTMKRGLILPSKAQKKRAETACSAHTAR